MMVICTNCNQEIAENYCSKCGEPAKLKRIDLHYILHEIEHILHLEKGIFYTIKELLVRPGHNVRTFISNNRSRLVKPVLFIFITSLIYTVVNHFFHVEDTYINFDESKAPNVINEWVQNHYGYANIIMGVYIALWSKLFFRKYSYNFFEILILLCFVMGMGMLLFALFSIIEGIMHIQLMKISGVIFIIYSSWAIGQFFEKKKYINYLKALAVYILGMMTFSLSVLLLEFLLVIILKH
jgi:hypothetical protein